MGFGQALSGLNAAATNLDVIGNNIANAGTVGFKSGTASFSDVYASAAVGLGTQVAAINQQFSTGTLTTTQNPFDLAIDGATGFFRVVDTNGGIKYTRNGQFLADKDGFIVNAQGDKLTGYALDGITLEEIKVPDGNMAPNATDTVTARVNLDARETVPTVAFDPTNADSFNHVLPINVYDSLGNDVQVLQYFRKTAAGDWDVYYTAGGVRIPDATTVHQIGFSTAGLIDAADASVTFTGVDLGQGGAAQDITFNYANSTQYGDDFNSTPNQDGYPSGEYASMSIEPDGSIVASYTNGQTEVRGYLALVDFANVNGLQSAGGNAWRETGASGQPIVGRPGTNGLSLVKSMAVEESNVDMSQELVNMIIAQRTYQANAQTIKTQDQILQTLIQMR